MYMYCTVKKMREEMTMVRNTVEQVSDGNQDNLDREKEQDKKSIYLPLQTNRAELNRRDCPVQNTVCINQEQPNNNLKIRVI